MTGFEVTGFEVTGFEVTGFEVTGFEVTGFDKTGFENTILRAFAASRQHLPHCKRTVNANIDVFTRKSRRHHEKTCSSKKAWLRVTTMLTMLSPYLTQHASALMGMLKLI
jgi:hypothetical protein